ncbi:hypothetical protein OQA88_10488 [Cercophora sp. LCS_1]
MADATAPAPQAPGQTPGSPSTANRGVKRRADEATGPKAKNPKTEANTQHPNKKRKKKSKSGGKSLKRKRELAAGEAWEAAKAAVAANWDDDEALGSSSPSDPAPSGNNPGQDSEITHNGQNGLSAPTLTATVDLPNPSPGIEFFINKTTWQLPRPYVAWEKMFILWLKYVVRSNLTHRDIRYPDVMKDVFYYHLLVMQRIPKDEADKIMQEDVVTQLQAETLAELITEAELLKDNNGMDPEKMPELARARLSEIRDPAEPEWAGPWTLPSNYRFARELELIPVQDTESLIKFFRFWCAWLVIFSRDTGLEIDPNTGLSEELIMVNHGTPEAQDKGPLAGKVMSAFTEWLAWTPIHDEDKLKQIANAARRYISTLDELGWEQLLSGAVRPTTKCPPADQRRRIWKNSLVRPFVISPYETYCVDCWSYQHVLADCPVKCVACLSHEHTIHDCPVKKTTPCYLCRIDGHSAHGCPGYRGRERTGMEQLYPGLYIIIPDPLKIRKIKNRHIACYSCASDKHYYHDCPGSKEKGISKKNTQPAFWKFDSLWSKFQYVDPESDFDPDDEEQKRLRRLALTMPKGREDRPNFNFEHSIVPEDNVEYEEAEDDDDDEELAYFREQAERAEAYGAFNYSTLRKVNLPGQGKGKGKTKKNKAKNKGGGQPGGQNGGGSGGGGRRGGNAGGRGGFGRSKPKRGKA